MAESLVDLPPNILIEILVRLPLKTLFAIRCVCRIFLNITTPNPYFIALHSSTVPESLVFQFGDVYKPSPLLRLLEPVFDIATENFRLRPIFRWPKIQRSHRVSSRCNSPEENKLVLVNSCNGLLYFVATHDPDELSLLCNPVTNEYVMIPEIDKDSFLGSRTKSLWLGFSPGSNRYKVLRIFSSIYGEPEEMGAQMLVVGSNSWRDIGHMPLGRNYLWDSCPTFLNGVIYWLDHSWQNILFFDFDREMFGDIALPHEYGEEQLRNRHCCMSIGVLGGCLCLSYNVYKALQVDIWLMKKHGNQESWIKEFIIDTVRPMGGRTFGGFLPHCGGVRPLQVLRNGEILMLWISYDLVCYDPKNKILRFVGFHSLKLNPKVVGFTPSIVPLKDTLLTDKVMVHVRPRGDETDP